MKGNAPDSIAYQIHGSAVPDIDVIGRKKVRAEVTSLRDCYHKTNKDSEMSLSGHGVKRPNDPSAATRRTGRNDGNCDAPAGFAAAHRHRGRHFLTLSNRSSFPFPSGPVSIQ